MHLTYTSLQGSTKRKFTVLCPEANQECGADEVEHAVRLMSSTTVGQSRPLILLQLEVSCEAMLSLCRQAREHGCPVALKASPLASSSLVEDAKSILNEGVSICFLNETEAPMLLGWDEPKCLETVEQVRARLSPCGFVPPSSTRAVL